MRGPAFRSRIKARVSLSACERRFQNLLAMRGSIFVAVGVILVGSLTGVLRQSSNPWAQALVRPRGIFAIEGGSSRGDVQWRAIASAKETEDFVLLFFSNAVAHFIPKAAFETPVELSRLRRLVSDAIGPRASWSAAAQDATT